MCVPQTLMTVPTLRAASKCVPTPLVGTSAAALLAIGSARTAVTVRVSACGEVAAGWLGVSLGPPEVDMGSTCFLLCLWTLIKCLLYAQAHPS